VSPDAIAQLVGGLGAGALAWQGRKVIPLLRLFVRLVLDTRRKVRRLEAALDHHQGTPTDGPPRPRTVTPAPDQLELDAQRVLGELGTSQG
jgi:hypothetical protein